LTDKLNQRLSDSNCCLSSEVTDLGGAVEEC